MNFKMIGYYVSMLLAVEGLFMLPALIICLADGDSNAATAFLYTILLVALIVGVLFLFCRKRPQSGFYEREGMVCVGLGWTILSIIGALPFFFSGEIPHFIDALFETVSGFTTTGATILTDVEVIPRGLLYWRSFSHWLGGMGVLVFLLAVAPLGGKGGFTIHLLRAESTGPAVGKLVPKMRQTASILYVLYIALTLLNMIFLLVGKMPFFEAVCIAMGTAGTGGFGTYNDSLASYSPYLQSVTTVFMALFGINFSCYYLILLGNFRKVLKNSELRMYICMLVAASLLIAINIRDIYPTFFDALHHSAFQVSSIMTTTGYATANFDLWPSFSKAILLVLMFMGACAGSTGGGFKLGRALVLLKTLRRSIHKVINPQKVEVIKSDDGIMDENTISRTGSYLSAYAIIVLASFLVVSIDGFSVETNISAVVACFNNVGPGFDMVGPVGNFSEYGLLSKLVLIFDMLAGRLEIFPMLMLFSRGTWKRH
ncbi:MAG: TrkH family potassium uptake protein [Oscillospiraceae bacterium]|nr:TrkH family potassium uptake protein [Oscillospiraceae bacterium]